ncbi:MAG: SDR family oxidoreductase [Alphaproteobacteria bacterium]
MNRFSLDGRLALVTGASRGIGAALAVGLAEAGADLVITGRHPEALTETAGRITAIGRQARVATCDVSSVASIESCFGALGKAGVVADILINNAGVEEVRASLDVDEALWEKIIGTNLRGAFFVAQQFARALVADDRQGAIVNICSLTSGVGIPTAAPYTASKSGLLGVTRALSAEWAARGIRVNGIGPGYFRTEMTQEFYQDEDWQTAMSAKIPMARFGKLDDLIGSAVFLASDAAAYVTGQLLYVDGGFMASI